MSGAAASASGMIDFVFYLTADWETFHRPKMIEALAAAGGGELVAAARRGDSGGSARFGVRA